MPDVVWHGLSADLVCTGRPAVLDVLREQVPVRCDGDALELVRAPGHLVLGTRSDSLPHPPGIIGYEIVELAEPELLVLRSDPVPHAGMREPGIVRIELHAQDGGTRLVLTDGPFPADGARGAEAGWNAALDQLEGRLLGR